jgi:hypothetical protein
LPLVGSDPLQPVDQVADGLSCFVRNTDENETTTTTFRRPRRVLARGGGLVVVVF